MLFCLECVCDSIGSNSSQCGLTGVCPCKEGYTGDKCDTCKSDYYRNGNGECEGKTLLYDTYKYRLKV